jgi:Ser/Thr protein kinase RdoA (MazF antagonist)
MMKLSIMKALLEQTDEEWRSPVAETIVQGWDYDKDTLFFWRASANFIFVFHKNGQKYFLRFSEQSEKALDSISAEMEILEYLRMKGIPVVQVIPSKLMNQIETSDTSIGSFNAVVFKALQGQHLDFSNLHKSDFENWGKLIGRIHQGLKTVPADLANKRKNWKMLLEESKDFLANDELHNEYNLLMEWGDTLSRHKGNYGLIHYDAELDNIMSDGGCLSILDFDDCAQHWFAADIAFALRDLFETENNLNHPSFITFMNGYRTENNIEQEEIENIPMFLRMHNLIQYGRLARAVDLEKSKSNPEWLNGIIDKFNARIHGYISSL